MQMTIFFVLMAILCILDIKKQCVPNIIVLPATLIAMIILKTYIPTLITLGLATLIYSKGLWCAGDVKLATMVSAFLGFPGLIVVALTALIAQTYVRIKRINSIPTAPFMLVTSFAVLFLEGLLLK